MKRFWTGIGIFSCCILVAGAKLFAADAEVAAAGDSAIKMWLALGGGLGLGIAAAGCGMGQGKMVASAMEGIGRNPEAADKMFTPMILGLAFIEALSIYALIYCIVFKFLVL